MDYEDLISNDYCMDNNEYYDKTHYSKYSSLSKGLITACHVPKNQFSPYVTRYRGKRVGYDWVTFFCASLYLGIKNGKIP